MVIYTRKNIWKEMVIHKMQEKGKAQGESNTKWKHPLVPTMTLILSGHDGDDAKLYQIKVVRDLLQQVTEVKRNSAS